MISFIVPAHNEEFELPATLRALRVAADAAAGQPYEIVVVDDSSTDGTGRIAIEFGARVVPVRLRQIAAVRNAGARAAIGDTFVFVDADTHITATNVTQALEALDAACVGGSARFKPDRAVPLWARLFLRLFCAVYFTLGLGIGAFIFTRRQHFEAVGGFDERYFAGEEMYLTLALRKLGRFVILTEPITTSARKIRMHSGRSLFAQWLRMLLGGRNVLRGRQALDLWYDGKREDTAAS
ncbi:MAG: glycosyltransferase [Verrucomicrobiota bacterium]|nr:glycosyltransferase [Verrucomicrobiota bacterium]